MPRRCPECPKKIWLQIIESRIEKGGFTRKQEFCPRCRKTFVNREAIRDRLDFRPDNFFDILTEYDRKTKKLQLRQDNGDSVQSN